MPSGYHHLTYEERCQIDALKQRGDSLRSIAIQLNVDVSTISREMSRNSGKRRYSYKQANTFAQQRRQKASLGFRKLQGAIEQNLVEKLERQWSPEQISGWLARHQPLFRVSHETIYKHIWRDKRNGGSLYKSLRHKGKKYCKRSANKAGRGHIPNRVGIEERPEEANAKSRVGDWELDTVIGCRGEGDAIVSMVDRASKLTKLAKVPSKHAEVVSKALIDKLGELESTVYTLTADNGKEFAKHEEVATALSAKFFFATPYHSWERGLNEHTNGLVRQYLPKGCSLEDITQEDLDKIEFLLNSRPRKVLQFATPIEVFNSLKTESGSVALQN